MKKIPTIFERDWNGDRSRVLNKPHPDCAWVFAGEGIPTQKIDGTSCMVRDGKLFKRYEMRDGRVAPQGFELVEYDPQTDRGIGWVPVGDGPADRWHREAFSGPNAMLTWADGTYELAGPKVQGNPEGYTIHVLCAHDALQISENVPRTFDALRSWLAERNTEGIVWHHPDGRMAKIKKRDFGLTRMPEQIQAA